MTNLSGLFTSEDRSDGRKKDIEAIVNAIFSKIAPEQKSVLSDEQVIHLVRGMIFAERYKSKIMRALVEHVLETRVSIDGRGRNDLVKALQATILASQDETTRGLREKLLG